MDGDTEKKSTEFDVEVADATSVLANDPTETPTSTLTDDATAKEASSDSVPAISSYQIKPTLHDKYVEVCYAAINFDHVSIYFLDSLFCCS